MCKENILNEYLQVQNLLNVTSLIKPMFEKYLLNTENQIVNND